MAAFVQRLPGSIGYVEYAYVKQNNLAYTKLISADGKAVSCQQKRASAPPLKALTGAKPSPKT
jgi:phosphate transport system substrate-binding protein